MKLIDEKRISRIKTAMVVLLAERLGSGGVDIYMRDPVGFNLPKQMF
ncbi:hypothetical protein SDC9_154198 [bioreactor metagenome]|uniref:Uncharacterized protein n=1 Tax=bioreactor metagenome TaxID=1076179 RepID=A0A645EY46_9ZZZZ